MDPLMFHKFHPTNEEIIHHFLESKMRDGNDFVAIKQVDICSFEPSQLLEQSPLPPDEGEWYFFHQVAYKYANSNRMDRTTKAGYWKVTGKDRDILDGESGKLIGKKKTLVYYQGRGSNATKTDWVIHEFHSANASCYQKPFVLCRLKNKSDS